MSVRYRFTPLPTAPGEVQQYLVENTFFLKIGIKSQRVTLIIPCREWLNQGPNHDLFQRLGVYQGVMSFRPGFAGEHRYKFSISFGAFAVLVLQVLNARTIQGIQLMDDLCHRLGHPQGEVTRISPVLLRVWRAEAAETRKRAANARRRRH
jgi:hypothetical protein